MSRLRIIDFIEGHSDWEQLLTSKPYALKIKRSTFADGQFVMFNYDQIESDSYDPIVAEARGLVLQIADGLPIIPVRKGFRRFFNIGEGPAAKIDWDTAEATIKEDGTLVFASYYNGKWHYGTRQNFDLDEAPMNSELYPTFGNLWKDVLKKHYPRFNETNLIHGLTYCFELCTRHNRVVIDYPEPKIFLLAVFVNRMAEAEFPRAEAACEAERLGVDVPAYYRLSSEAEYYAMVEAFGVQHEGLVVRDAKNDRVKMKSKLYFDLHKTMSNGAMDLEAIIGLCRAGEEAEFLSYFPKYDEAFARVKEQIAAAYKRVSDIRRMTIAERDEMKWTKKDFALFHVNDRDSMLWFKAWEDKLTDDFIMAISNEKFISLFGIK